MRIIGGELKSRKISFPKSRLTRPMTDRTKETLFNIVGGLVVGKNVLDLYAGSGSIGLEAISRGALNATFVDQADWAVKVIRRNLNDLDVQEKGDVVKGNVLRVIDKLKNKYRIQENEESIRPIINETNILQGEDKEGKKTGLPLMQPNLPGMGTKTTETEKEEEKK